MPANTKDMKRDARGNLLPQYFQPLADEFQPVHGDEGALFVSTLAQAWREDFSSTSLSGDWELVVQGAGHSYSVSSSVLSLTTGVTANTETIIRSTRSFRVPFRVFFIFYLSQRIANQEFYLEIVDDSGNMAARWLLDGTSATTGKIQVVNGGVASSASSVTINSTGSYNILELELFPDEVYFHSRTADSTSSRSYTYVRHRLIPDPKGDYFIQIRAKNLSSAPASSTTLYLDAVTVQDIYELAAEITAGRGATAGSQALPIYVTGGSSNVWSYNRLVYYTETTTTLGANGSFTGSAKDSTVSGIGSYARFLAGAFADQPGTLYLELSRDSSTWRVAKQVSVSANTLVIEEIPFATRYARVRYQNGSTAQKTFELWSALVAI